MKNYGPDELKHTFLNCPKWSEIPSGVEEKLILDANFNSKHRHKFFTMSNSLTFKTALSMNRYADFVIASGIDFALMPLPFPLKVS